MSTGFSNMTGMFRRVWRSRYLEAGRFLRISCSLSGDMVWGDKDLLSRMTVLGEEKMGFGENTGLSIRRLKRISKVCASLSPINTEKRKLFLR